MRKRILSILLVIAMLMTCLPVAVFADSELASVGGIWDLFMPNLLNENEYAMAEAAIGTIGAAVSDSVGETGETKFTYEAVDILFNAIIDYPELSAAFATVGTGIIGTIKRAALNRNIIIGDEETYAYGEFLISTLEMILDYIIDNPDYSIVYANGGALLLNDIGRYEKVEKEIYGNSESVLVIDFLFDFYKEYDNVVNASKLDSETLKMLYNVVLMSYEKEIDYNNTNLPEAIQEVDADYKLLLEKVEKEPETAIFTLAAYSAWVDAKLGYFNLETRAKVKSSFMDLMDCIAQLPNFGGKSTFANSNQVKATEKLLDGDINYVKEFIENANKKIKSAESCEDELSLITESTLYFMLMANKEKLASKETMDTFKTWWERFTDDIIKYPQCASALCILATDTIFDINPFFENIETIADGTSEIPVDASEPFYDATVLYESETIFENYKLIDDLLYTNDYIKGGMISAISSLADSDKEILNVGEKVLEELYNMALKAFLEDSKSADMMAHMAQSMASYLVETSRFKEGERAKHNEAIFSTLEGTIEDAKKIPEGFSGLVSQTMGYLGAVKRCYLNNKDTKALNEMYKLGRDVLLENPEASAGLGKVYAALLDAVGECGYRNPESGPFPEDASDLEVSVFESEESKPHPFTRLFSGLSEAMAEKPEFQVGIATGGQGAVGAAKRCITNMMEWDGEAGKEIMTHPEKYEAAELLVDYYFDMLDTICSIYGKNRVSELAATALGKIEAACSDAYGEVLYKNKTLQRIAEQMHKKCAKVILDSPESSIAIGIFGQGMVGAIKRVCINTSEYEDICEHLLDNFDILSKAIEKNYTAQVALGKMGAASMDAIGEILVGPYQNKEEYVKDIETFIDMMIEDAEEIPYASIGLTAFYQGVIGAAKRNGMANKPNEALFETYDYIMGYMKSIPQPRRNSGGSGGGSKVKEPVTTECPKDDTCPLTKFEDTNPAQWYHDGIEYCLKNGIMNGISSTQFAPNNTLTRGMVVTMLARLSGEAITSTGAEWYADGQAWAMRNGISDGTNMTANITREQLATMLYRYAIFKSVDTDEFVKDTNTLSYADVFTISDWAAAGMNFCIAASIIGGDNNGMLNPAKTATRAEAATMFQRLGEKVLAN